MVNIMPDNTPEIRNARELASHSTEIKHLQTDMDKLSKDMEEVKDALREISHTLSAAKGGWHMLMVVGSIGAGIGAGVTWVIDFMKH